MRDCSGIPEQGLREGVVLAPGVGHLQLITRELNLLF